MSLPEYTLKHKKALSYVLCVEGNIGSGKSTLLTNLSRHGFTVIEEPIEDIWGQYLPRLYQDSKRWGFAFQMEAMDWFRQLQSKKFEHLLQKMKQESPENEMKSPEALDSSEDDQDFDVHSDQENMGDMANSPASSRLSMSPQKQLLRNKNRLHSSCPLNRIIIVERSALSAITIFAKNLLETGLMTEWEYSLLLRFYSMIAWQPKHILYLQCDPGVCTRRIQQRNRDGEGNVDPKLIQSLHNRHEIMFNGKQERKGEDAQNVLIVDGRKNARNVLQEALQKIATLDI